MTQSPLTQNPFVSTQWLADHLGDPDVTVIDASWHMPAAGRSGAAEFEEGHIPGAVFFDIDAVADKTTGLPHMLPTPGQFETMVGALGIGSDKTLVIYDQSGLFSAPRAWWTFTVMGAKDVKILEGGSPKWKAEGRPLETGPAKTAAVTFTAHFHPELVRDFDAVLSASRSGQTIVDARPAARFSGETPEPRAGLASGHIPGSANVPAGDLTRDGALKPVAELQAIFDAAGIDRSKPIITSCGSGVTAAILTLALRMTGATDVALYDGSWTEWGGRADAPVER